jgi:hypothetical protein
MHSTSNHHLLPAQQASDAQRRGALRDAAKKERQRHTAQIPLLPVPGPLYPSWQQPVAAAAGAGPAIAELISLSKRSVLEDKVNQPSAVAAAGAAAGPTLKPQVQPPGTAMLNVPRAVQRLQQAKADNSSSSSANDKRGSDNSSATGLARPDSPGITSNSAADGKAPFTTPGQKRQPHRVKKQRKQQQQQQQQQHSEAAPQVVPVNSASTKHKKSRLDPTVATGVGTRGAVTDDAAFDFEMAAFEAQKGKQQKQQHGAAAVGNELDAAEAAAAPVTAAAVNKMRQKAASKHGGSGKRISFDSSAVPWGPKKWWLLRWALCDSPRQPL